MVNSNESIYKTLHCGNKSIDDIQNKNDKMYKFNSSLRIKNVFKMKNKLIYIHKL